MIFLTVAFLSKIQDITHDTLATDKASSGASCYYYVNFSERKQIDKRDVFHFLCCQEKLKIIIAVVLKLLSISSI